MSSPTLPFSSAQVTYLRKRREKEWGRRLVWACANTGVFCPESRVLILDVVLSHAVVLVLSGSIIQNQCIHLGVQSSIKLSMHVLFHISYTESRSTIILVRFYLYCYFFLSLYPQLPAQVSRSNYILYSQAWVQGSKKVTSKSYKPQWWHLVLPHSPRVRRHRKKQSVPVERAEFIIERTQALCSSPWADPALSFSHPDSSMVHETKLTTFHMGK